MTNLIDPAKVRDWHDIPHSGDLDAVYGAPGAEIESRLGYLTLPYSFKLEWSPLQRVSRVRVHRLCIASLGAALEDVLKHYGRDGIAEYKLDLFSGTYNHRRQRGGSNWSTHAYGAAIDFYAAGNGNSTPFVDSVFSKPDYEEFLDIMEEHGWLNGGRLWGRDAMHFQRARGRE